MPYWTAPTPKSRIREDLPRIAQQSPSCREVTRSWTTSPRPFSTSTTPRELIRPRRLYVGCQRVISCTLVTSDSLSIRQATAREKPGGDVPIDAAAKGSPAPPLILGCGRQIKEVRMRKRASGDLRLVAFVVLTW